MAKTLALKTRLVLTYIEVEAWTWAGARRAPQVLSLPWLRPGTFVLPHHFVSRR